MKTLAPVALVLLVACGATVPEDDTIVVVPAAAAPAPAPDARVAELQVLMTELLDRIEVMNARLARLEAGGAAVPVPAQAAAPAETPRTVPPARPSRPTPSRPVAAALGDQYREALTLYGRGRLDDARALFERIHDADPSGDLADNALYWIAETHFAQGRFNEAVGLYRTIVSDYASANKAPDAWLKMGMAYARLGDLGMAKETFERLIAEHPYTTAAATARNELDRVRY